MQKNNKYSAEYFLKTNKIIQKHAPDAIVTLQFFQREDDSILCGMNEVLEFLKNNTDINKYSIRHLPEGSLINAKEVVLELEGQYKYFGIYEGVIDGILARQTSIASNARKTLNATNKELIFMGDRADHYENQTRDGYAAFIGGIKTQVTEAQTAQHDGKPVGTMPHALIQMFAGDIEAAVEAYIKTFPNEKVVALVDYNNDSINDSIKLVKKFGDKIYGVRIDTGQDISDSYFKNDEEKGVTPNLIKALRKALDQNAGEHIKIIVSSGFNWKKIQEFEAQNTPVDIYGVGGSILKINNIFTADAVKLNGVKHSKFGRGYRENPKLKKAF